MGKLRIILGRIKNRKKIHKLIDTYVEQYKFIPKELVEKYRKWLYRDSLRAKLKYGVGEKEYFQGQFFRKSKLAREESMLTGYRFQFRRSLQSKESLKIFLDKHLLYKKYEKFLGRKYKLVDANTTFEEIKEFTDGLDCFFAKTLNGMGGKGVRKINISTDADIVDFMNDCTSPTLIEQEIKQNKEIAKFNKSSVNTLRIVTLITKKGDVIIPTACLRIGKDGNCVDNFSSGGIACKVNIEHGIITNATDAMGKKYVYHPNSKLQLIGFKIPEWDKYKQFAIELAKQDLTMRYVGWDIIIDENNSLIMIEGNEGAGFDIQEMAMDNVGLKPYYLALLNDDREFNYNRFE